MNRWMIMIVIILFSACKEKGDFEKAQKIVDKSIEESGGVRYTESNITFDFRGNQYSSEVIGKQKILKRRIKNDSVDVLDVKSPKGFQRWVKDSLVVLEDSLANAYANSVNSIHYFAYLPYGLNDAAVNKKFLGKVSIAESEYYKVEVTFEKYGGGDDYDDIYIYWFNTTTFKPDYLAYEFHIDGGGQRFRVAYNERIIDGIRFVDYKNYKPKTSSTSIYAIDDLYQNNGLELLSEIKLENIKVN